MTDYNNEELSNLIGRTLRLCVQDGNHAIRFQADSGERWEMVYEPDCCASCQIEDVVGDLGDLVGSPIVMAEAKKLEFPDESFTWTFYKLATVKGYVMIRWYGSSNGYYSETASFRRVRSDE